MNETICFIEGYQIQIFGMEHTEELQSQFLGKPIVYVNCISKEEGIQLWEILPHDCILVCIRIENWNDDLSPWEAESIMKNQKAFAGLGKVYLEKLIHVILPGVEKKLSFTVQRENRMLAGYSMAGLFALFSCYETDLFGCAASASGSLWFPGFLEYAMENPFPKKPPGIYLSLGNRESKTKNPYMQTVEMNTRNLHRFYQKKGIRTTYRTEEGGHFKAPVERLARGIRWCLLEEEFGL